MAERQFLGGSAAVDAEPQDEQEIPCQAIVGQFRNNLEPEQPAIAPAPMM
jgi:hypothetical protein